MQVTNKLHISKKEKVNMKEIYTIPKMELKYAECEDIIKTSGEEDELPFVPTSQLHTF